MTKNIKSIYDTAARNTAKDMVLGTLDDGDVEGESKIEEIQRRSKDAIKKTSKEMADGKFYQTYLDTLNSLQSQKVRLSGRIGISQMRPQMAGKVTGVGMTKYKEKLAEVKARMRKFATEKYYASIGGYGGKG